MKTEIESKKLLEKFGIATTKPRLARTRREAEQYAKELGGRLVLKIVAADIVHKLAAGGVKLEISPDAAGSAFDEIVAACRESSPQASIEGVLIENMVESGVEVFIGGRVDPEYGAVILLGLGGSYVEQGTPPRAALVPLSDSQARELISVALPERILTHIGTAERNKLAEYLTLIAGPSGMLLTGAVNELDINPLIVTDNDIVAVDAVVGGPKACATTGARMGHEQIAQERSDRITRLENVEVALFCPESIAFIGASTSPAKLGYRNIKNLVDLGFKGTIYPIHPTATEIYGVPAFAALDDVPRQVDRAYIALASEKVKNVLENCIANNIKVAQVLTAGFSEYEGNAASEKELKDILGESTMRMIGPNCMGTFSVHSRIPMGAARYCPTGESGITFISQSGTYAGDVVRRSQVKGLPLGQVLSCGNCADLDIIDYLLFCERDPKTCLIAFYIESLRQPGLFFRLASEVSKPIVILRGGATELGIAAASSHTAALATDQTLWAAGVEQAGILQVHTLDELMDALLIHSAHDYLSGNRIGIFGSGGGVSVTASDTAARADMVVPSLTDGTAHSLQRFGVPGTSVANPIDIPVWGLREAGKYILDEVINALKDDKTIDSVIVYIEMGSIMDFADSDDEGLEELDQICQSIERSRQDGPPMSLVLRSTGDRVQEDFVREQRVKLLRRGIAVFVSTSKAVCAHSYLWRMTGCAEGRESIRHDCECI